MVTKPATTEGAETAAKATFGRIARLGSEWREGKADERRDPSRVVRAAGVRGSSGIDGVSVERFAAGAGRYLAELHEDLK